MPFALAFIGIVLVVVGARGKASYTELKNLLIGDFTGQHNFFSWIMAIGLVGVVGYVPGAEKISRAFLVLIFVVLFIATKGGFFTTIRDTLANYQPSANQPANGGSPGMPDVGKSIGDAVKGAIGTQNGTPVAPPGSVMENFRNSPAYSLFNFFGSM